jgi:hypothetical protein
MITEGLKHVLFSPTSSSILILSNLSLYFHVSRFWWVCKLPPAALSVVIFIYDNYYLFICELEGPQSVSL